MSTSVESKKLHPRIAVSGLCFPRLSAVESIRVIGELGVTNTSMVSSKLFDSGVEAVREACGEHGVKVTTTTGLVRFDLAPGADVATQLQRAREDIDRAAAVGASSVYTLTGPRVFDDWDDNLDVYARLVRPVVDFAAERGVVLAIEPASWLYSDFTFVHTFHDSIALARRADMRVCLDLFHVWTERELHEDIKEHIDLISHVQLSDLQRGARSLPCRAMLGAGAVPIRAIVQWLLEAGYQGVFDLELDGPTIEEVGHREAAARSAAWLDALLVELGA